MLSTCFYYVTVNESRRKVGRPRKGEALRVPVTFSVDPEVRAMAQELRNAGYPLNEVLSLMIAGAYADKFGPEAVKIEIK